ncbi:MAG: ATP-binding protein [Sphaerobacter sp.]|nr:ATP-binding protein [Sphaerobacter sp.]
MSIRFRVALLTTVLMAVVLGLIGTGVYITLQRSLNQEVNGRLAEAWARAARQVQSQSRVTLDNILFPPPDLDPVTFPGLYAQLTQPNGQFYRNSPRMADYIALPEDVLRENLAGRPVYFTVMFRGVPMRVLSVLLVAYPTQEPVVTLQVAEPLNPMLQTLRKLRLLMAAGGGLGLVATAVGAYVLAGRSLRPLSQITTTARDIGHEGDLSRRIELPAARDEVRQLVETFNEMLSRLEEAFAAERRFVADASHELRTPLTALRGNAEILLRQIDAGRWDPADLQEGLADIRDEAERMGRLVQNLLTLARADVGWRPELEVIHLDQVAADAARLVTPLARQHDFRVRSDGEIDVIGNADQLKQLLLILLDNAFTYTPQGGEVELQVHRRDGIAEIVVRDTGPGIPPAQRQRIFDRFYRGDAARTHGAAGAGLGLAIARWIVDCHAGAIQIEDAEGGGTLVRVTVPLAPAPDDRTDGRRPAVAPVPVPLR